MLIKIFVLVLHLQLVSRAIALSSTAAAGNANSTSVTSTPASISSLTTPTSSPQTCNETVFDACLSNGLGINTTTSSTTAAPPTACLVGSSSQCNSSAALPTCNATISANSSSLYGLLCTSSGLSLYRVSSTTCQTINDTTAYLCNNVLQSKNVSCSGNSVLTGAQATTVAGILARNCPQPVKTTTALPLLPNPVGPAAITAIVVMVCLFITAVLATFFFWPKCHIANPAAEAVKRATKPSAAKAASAAATTSGTGNKTSEGAVGGGAAAAGGKTHGEPGYNVQYDGDRNAATIRMPAVPGPSAA